jgi:hypothetical protein
LKRKAKSGKPANVNETSIPHIAESSLSPQ